MASVTCSAPPVRFQTSQVSTVPKQSSPRSARSRAPGDVVEDPADLRAGEVGVEDEAGLLAEERLVAGRLRRSQRPGGAPVLPDDRVVDGPPGPRSQTTVVSRWLVMPIAAMSPAASPARATASAATRGLRRPDLAGSCSTQPGRGKICGNSRCAVATIRPSRSKTIARELVVPWSSASTYFVIT